MALAQEIGETVGIKADIEWEGPLNYFICSIGVEKTNLEGPAHEVLL